MQSENILDSNDDFFSSWACFWPNVIENSSKEVLNARCENNKCLAIRVGVAGHPS